MNQEAYDRMKKCEAEVAKKWQDEQNDKWIAKWSASPAKSFVSITPNQTEIESFWTD